LVLLLLLLLLLLLQGTAVLKGNFDVKSLELVLSTLQVGAAAAKSKAIGAIQYS
jgi:hypothetical protein